MGWQEDLSKSNAFFMAKVWPEISSLCGGGEIKPVEMMDDSISKDLDMHCGIDLWQTVEGSGCRGIASRVQFGDKNWRTFTIRKSRDSGSVTEYQKRKEAIDSEGKFIYPYLTCHAYSTMDGDLIGGGIARTKDVFNAINESTITNRTINASFYAVRFDDVECFREFG
jgi:hypothetical protein